MKERELKRCFAYVRPREQLVEATLARVHALQDKKQMESERRAAFDWGFATRLASAACAFLLVIGLGIGIGTTNGLPHAAGIREADAAEMIEPSIEDQPAHDVPLATSYDAESMSERAAAMADDWAVLDAVIDMATGDGSMILCVSEVRYGSGLVIDSTADGRPTLLAHFDVSSEQMQTVFDAVGGQVLVGVHAELREGTPIWVVHELHLVNAD